jgi:hypothetical protein
MDRSRYLMSFFFIALSIGINTAQHLFAQLNISRSYLLFTLVAMTTAGLIAHRNLLFILLVFFLSVTINLPTDVLTHYSVDRQILLATLLSIIIVPTCVKLWS